MTRDGAAGEGAERAGTGWIIRAARANGARWWTRRARRLT